VEGPIPESLREPQAADVSAWIVVPASAAAARPHGSAPLPRLGPRALPERRQLDPL